MKSILLSIVFSVASLYGSEPFIVIHQSVIHSRKAVGQFDLFYNGKEYLLYNVDGKLSPKFKTISPSNIDSYLNHMTTTQLIHFIENKNGRLKIDITPTGMYTLMVYSPHDTFNKRHLRNSC